MTLNAAPGDYPRFSAFLPKNEITEGNYRLRFAQHTAELDAVLRLRFEIFNLELKEGLDSSFQSGRDLDEFDANCHHLLVSDATTRQVVGTYRMQTLEMAGGASNFYSATEFDLACLPEEVLHASVELGRACVAKKYRNARVLYLLWRGLALYLTHNHKRYLFGCCSLTSQNPEDGKRVMDYLAAHGHVHPQVVVNPQPGYFCYEPGFAMHDEKPVSIPHLMQLYLTLGAQICGPPAIDRLFKTIDYLTLLDVQGLDSEKTAYFFRS